MNAEKTKNGADPQENRIREMELCFEKAADAVLALEEAIDGFNSARPLLKRLSGYQESGRWQKDFEADEQGKLPQDLKRGVLSEDGLYDLLTRAQALAKCLRTE